MARNVDKEITFGKLTEEGVEEQRMKRNARRE